MTDHTKGAWSGSHDPFFNFDALNHIFGLTEATVAKFCMRVEHIRCLAFSDTDYSLMGMIRVA